MERRDEVTRVAGALTVSALKLDAFKLLTDGQLCRPMLYNTECQTHAVKR